jgi:DNA-damage-inducible protein D
MVEDKLIIFEENKIRRVWKEGDWFYSVIDIIFALTGSEKPRDYWYRLKLRELDHGIQLSAKIGQLKLKSPDNF